MAQVGPEQPLLNDEEKQNVDSKEGEHQIADSNVADFKYDLSGLHRLEDAFRKMKEVKGWESCDEGLALGLVACTTLFLVCTFGKWFVKLGQGVFHHEYPSSVALAKFSGDLITAVALAAIVLMWSTLCYRSPGVHKFWEGKYTKLVTKTLMPGGFAPRPTALSLGTLMFVTSTLIKEDLKSGAALTHDVIRGYEACRATEMEPVDVSQMWLPRLHRHGPANMGFTCFKVNQSDLFGYAFTAGAFTAADYTDPQELVSPQYHSGNTNLREESFLMHVRNYILYSVSKIIAAPGQDFTETMQCKYQCIKWQSVGVKSLLSSVSVLLVGCATITKFTDLLSTNFGGKRIGGQFVSENTSHEELGRIIKAAATWTPPFKSKLLCFLVLLSAFVIPMIMIAPKVCLDGYYSVDYWVTGIFLSSLLIALILRRWNPFLNEPMIFTRKLWADGEDVFVKVDPPNDTEYKKIDLYHWFHLSTKQRNNHLFKYARQVSSEDIDAEIERQKKMRNKCLTITVTSPTEDGMSISDRVYFRAPSKDNVSGWFWSGGEKAVVYNQANGTNTLEFDEAKNEWKFTRKDKPYLCKVKDAQGDIPPKSAEWENESETIVLEVLPAGTKAKTNKDLDTCKGMEIKKGSKGGVSIPMCFREKEGIVYYDPALLEEKQHEPLLVMSLNTFESVDWIEGLKGDQHANAEQDLTSDREKDFIVRKVRTTIARGTVGVVVSKKSNDEAVINWHRGEKTFFPPLKDAHPDDKFQGRIKATANLANLLEVGQNWSALGNELKKHLDLIDFKPDVESESEHWTPHDGCY